MATGRERRAERLNERLRGAQRANVEDESFHIDIPGLGSFPEPSPAPTSPIAEPEPAPTRVEEVEEEAAPTSLRPSPARKPTRSSPRHPYDLPETSEESIVPATTAQPIDEPQAEPESVAQVSSAPRSTASQRALVALPATTGFQSSSPRRPGRPRAVLEEVEESPVDAPSSGKRRHVQVSSALTSSARLHDALDSDPPQSSSPLAKKVRRSSVAASALSRRQSSRLAEQADADGVSPDRSRVAETAEGGDSPTGGPEEVEPEEPDLEPEEARSESRETEEPEPEEVEEPEPEEVEEPEPEEAEEISAVEAAKTLGRKRPRRSLPSRSPELGSESQEEEQEEDEQPTAKRQRGRPAKSPATQRQPATKPNPQKRVSDTRPRSKPESKAKSKAAAKPRRKSDENDGPSIEITVQRFVNLANSGVDDDDDPLLFDMPFANRVGENVVDVFAQVCMEVINATLVQVEEAAENAEDRTKKKELRVKIRAIEAYREELSSRLLQHAIHLNDWHSLRKRVRHVQKEKLSLRDEILQLKAEREQVALRMDAVRAKHEEDSKESTYRLTASSFMHDVDLAVEKGRDAPELSAKEQKDAHLANLELLISQITDDASSSSSSGGLLNQIKDFNAFLERAAIALETR